MPPRLHILSDHAAMSQAVFQQLLSFLLDQPRAILALPSGQTPMALYERLARDGRGAMRATTVFALDEYRGLGPGDPRSFRAFFDRHLFGPLGMRPPQANCLDGLAPDPAAELARYEAAIAAAGGLDLTLLGIGANGHIAFNEPAEALQAGCHLTRLQPPASRIAEEGLSMGVGTLLSAPRVWLMASGEDKAPAIKRMLSGTIDPRCPASFLLAHPDATLFLDAGAAAGL